MAHSLRILSRSCINSLRKALRATLIDKIAYSSLRFPFINQHTEEDCGAACLAMIAKYYKRTYLIAKIRQLIGTGQQGTTLLGLQQGAEKIGFKAQTVKASPEIINHMDKAPLPAILHWKGVHWVVLVGKRKNKFIIADPAVGIRNISAKELVQSTDWIMLLLEPDLERIDNLVDDSEQVSGLSRFLKRVLPYRPLLAQVLLLNSILGLLSLSSPYLMQILTDTVLIRGETQLLNQLAIAISIVHFISSSLRFAQSNLISHFVQRLQLGLEVKFSRQILSLPLSYYESHRSGSVVSLWDDIREINQLVGQVVIGLPSQFLIALISLALMLRYSAQLTKCAVVIALVMNLSTLVFLPKLQQKSRQLLSRSAEVSASLVEVFQGAITVKTTNATPQLFNEFQSEFAGLTNLTLSTMNIGIVNSTFSKLVSSLGTVLLLWLGSSLVIADKLTIGQLLAFNAMNASFIGFISIVIGFIDELARAKAALQRFDSFLKELPEESNKNKPWASILHNADINCSQLYFHHAGRTNLLDNFSVTIPGGKFTALIGESGCGKSTLVKLIASLYHPNSGNISFGMFNQQDLCLDCLRQQVILVPQDSLFFRRSIIENFRLGNPQASLSQIIAACQFAGADEFISKLPDRYQTILGEFGCGLSGGQKQRLAIARAMINDPPVLILDESTSALDPVSETKVLESILQHRKGKTTIMISHRPRIFGQAEWIVLLANGRVAKEGTPKDFP